MNLKTTRPRKETARRWSDRNVTVQSKVTMSVKKNQTIYMHSNYNYIRQLYQKCSSLPHQSPSGLDWQQPAETKQTNSHCIIHVIGRQRVVFGAEEQRRHLRRTMVFAGPVGCLNFLLHMDRTEVQLALYKRRKGCVFDVASWRDTRDHVQ